MWSEYIRWMCVDAVARTGSFSAAAEELHRVPSTISYSVRQLEEWLAVPLFEQRHRDVELTPAGALFVKARDVIKNEIPRHQCQMIANGWRGQFSIAVDCIVKPERITRLLLDFYHHFPGYRVVYLPELFNRGVGCAGVDRRVDGGNRCDTRISIGERYNFRDMGFMPWRAVVSPDHPLASAGHVLTNEEMVPYPSLCLEDTSRSAEKRDTWRRTG